MTPTASAPPTVIPDATGTILISFWLSGDDDVVRHVRYPVLAWAIEWAPPDSRVEPWRPVALDPLVCETPMEPWCLEVRTPGHPPVWIVPETASFDSFEAASAYAGEQLRRDRARRTEAAKGAPC